MAKAKKDISRMCCCCRGKKPVSELIRIAREKTEEESYKYFIDKVGNANGRGAYICKECIPRAIKTKSLNRSFKKDIGKEVYEELQGQGNAE